MVLYLLTTILLVILAYWMPCNGDYYEDAAKFADTYAEMIKRKKNGEMVMGLEEKKKKFRHMTVRYQEQRQSFTASFWNIEKKERLFSRK